jgi:rare lipoprotein A
VTPGPPGTGRAVHACLLALSLALGACTTAPPRTAAEPPARALGGYYLDDGPLPNPPADLDKVPDAQPRVEPIRPLTARPYSVMGRTYTPMAALAPYRAEGVASWYGKRYHGQATASGEIYDMFAMTAAHPTLPIPSYARVTNLQNGKSVVVRVNDRGPFHSDRLIDLSYTAAYKLDLLGVGSARVEVQSILPGNSQVAAVTGPSPRPPAPATQPGSGAERAPAPGMYVQLGAFGVRDNAEAFARRVRADLDWLSNAVGVFVQGSVYRVQAGPYATKADALEAASRIEGLLGFKPVLSTR